VGRSMEQHGWRWWRLDQDGCLDPAVTELHGGDICTNCAKFYFLKWNFFSNSL
jgi:hypothetical protein